MSGKWAAFLLISAIIGATLAEDTVPVLIWNPKEAQTGLPAVSAMQYIDYATFQAKYLESFNPTNILLFIQDALSIEDLSSHSAELHHVSQWMESGHSLYLPNVEDPAHLAHDLPSHDYNVVVLEPGTSIAGLNLKKGEKNLVIVKLPSTLTNPSRSHALQKADEVMENVISKIGEMEDFTIVFTGKAPSVKRQGGEAFEQRVRIARSLQAAPEKMPGSYHNCSCVLLYLYQNITINFNEDNMNKTIVIDENDWMHEDKGDCHKELSKIYIKYSNAELGKFSVTFVFKNVFNEWMMDSAVAQFNNVDYSFGLEKDQVTGIPMGMSYSCSGRQYLKTNQSSTMILDGFQVQAFSNNRTSFGPAWDCVGFFTVPIWCALLVTLLLLVILFTGMYMLGDIKTMDRFDDPKGKPIMVATAD